jgi:DNA anti-recombination protein RmuC
MLRPSNLLSLVAFVLIFFASSIVGSAQTAQSKPSPSPDPGNAQKTSSTSDDVPPLGPMEEEMRAKRAIKLAEKEYKDNLNRAREAAQISTQLRDSYKQNRSLTRDDNKRLERLEKLAKRIRSEAGGSSEDASPDEPPRELEATLARLAEVSETLRKSVESTPRQVVSASVIEQANVILELIKFTRNFSH